MLVRVNGTALHVAEHGAGPPLLALHGGLGLDHTTLRPWLDGLGERVRLIFPDLRGCGRSEPLDPDEPVTHATWVADLDGLRETLGIERWVVFGHSYGGYLALEYALAYPARVRGLVLCATGAAPTPGDVVVANAQAHAGARGTPGALAALAEGLAGPLGSDEAWEAVWRGVAPLYLHRPTPECVAAITEGIRYRAAAFNASFHGCLPAYDVRDRLGEIAAPALVLGGRHDWIHPPEHGAVPLADGLPNAELAIFEESGHFPFVEEPGAFRAAVAEWLASAEDAGREARA